jgi:hypothetical protein
LSEVRHTVFISYHHDDQDVVEESIETFDHERKVFINRALGAGMEQDIIDSNNTNDTIRRYVDWETVKTNGLLGIKLASYNKSGYPDRLNKNLKQNDQQKNSYAGVIDSPTCEDSLTNWIEDAFKARKTGSSTTTIHIR